MTKNSVRGFPTVSSPIPGVSDPGYSSNRPHTDCAALTRAAAGSPQLQKRGGGIELCLAVKKAYPPQRVPWTFSPLIVPQLRLEVLTRISGVTFAECHVTRIEANIGDVRVPLIDLQSLLKNKAASGRAKDLADIAALTHKSEERGHEPQAGS